MIYFVQAADGPSPIKIGFTDNLDARLKALEYHYGRPLAVLHTMGGGRDEEAEIHERFAHLRIGRTEQFRPDPDLMEFLGRPLLVSQGDVSQMKVVNSAVVIIHLKGSAEYVKWLDVAHETTRLAKTTIMRVALENWAKQVGLPLPPKI